jgi:glycosyltransferase involved in cell wall biosynthesis
MHRQNSPTISVVTIALEEKEVKILEKKLSDQTYQDFEIVYSTKEGIPEAWNAAVSKASGSIIMFTETDAEPVSDRWLQHIASEVNVDDEKVIKFGEFGGGQAFDLGNTVVPRRVMERYEFDETFSVAEDNEIFARMDVDGVVFENRNKVPVFHKPTPMEQHLERGFDYGQYSMKCFYRYGRIGPSSRSPLVSNDRNTGSLPAPIQFITSKLKSIVISILISLLFYLGVLYGAVRYLPEYLRDNHKDS